MKPLSGWVIVEPEEKRMVGSIILPETAKSETQTGIVVALPAEKSYVESGVVVSAPSLTVGDRVAFRKYHSSEIEVSEKKYQAIHFENIITKL